METIASLAAFNPAKLAMLLANQPADARIVGVNPTGPIIATPKADNNVTGQIVYEGDKLYVYCGGSDYEKVAQLYEFDGKPCMRWIYPLS